LLIQINPSRLWDKGAINIPFLFNLNKKHIEKTLFRNKTPFYKKGVPKKGGMGGESPPTKKGTNEPLIAPLLWDRDGTV
jgi:hypothetical protein